MTREEFFAILEHGPCEYREHTHHKDPEHQLQVRCVRWFRLTYTNHTILAIPNGGRRDKVTGAKLKAEGVVAGTPDLLIPESRHGYNCLWIEMKDGKKGVLSQAQKDMHAVLTDHGNLVKVVRSFDEFDQVCHDYFN